MKITFLTCANTTYLNFQKNLKEEISCILEDSSLNHIAFDEKHVNLDLEFTNSEFFEKNKKIAQSKQGAGFCIWKPFFIKNLLDLSDEDDIVIYIDSTDSVSVNTVKFIIDYITKNKTYILAWHQGTQKNKITVSTKRECLIKMNCDNDRYKNAQMIEAGFLVVVSSEKTKKIVNEWLEFCCEQECVLNDVTTKIPNYPEYKFNRYDQSVLSVLFEKHNLTKMQKIPDLKFNVRG